MLRQRLAIVAAAGVSVTLVAAILFGSRGLLHLRALTSEEAAIKQRIGGLLLENQRLRTQLHALRTDDRYLERLAREQLGFVRPGEVVYRFPGSNRPAPEVPPH
jgi:cell division protein FtsB